MRRFCLWEQPSKTKCVLVMWPSMTWKCFADILTHHPGVVAVRLDRDGRHRTVDPLLLLTTVTEPNPNHLLLHGQLLGNQAYLFWVGFGVLNRKRLNKISTLVYNFNGWHFHIFFGQHSYLFVRWNTKLIFLIR